MYRIIVHFTDGAATHSRKYNNDLGYVVGAALLRLSARQQGPRRTQQHLSYIQIIDRRSQVVWDSRTS